MSGSDILPAPYQAESGLPESYLPVEVVDMEVATTLEELDEANLVQRFIDEEIPGFVIRSGEFGATEVPSAVTKSIVTSLIERFEKLTQKELTEVDDKRTDRDYSSRAHDLGWHPDSFSANGPEVWRVQCFYSGGGSVELANSGQHIENLVKRTIFFNRIEAPKGHQIHEGTLIDTDIMEPKIYLLEDLRPGDVVVFRSQGHNPSWHNFITGSQGRHSETFEYMLVESDRESTEAA